MPFIIWYSERRSEHSSQPRQRLLSTERDSEVDAVRAAHAIETSGGHVHHIQRDDGAFFSRTELLQMWPDT
jgi:hypothetical protein